MNQKMTSVILVAMFYVNFMGPFVLRKFVQPRGAKNRTLHNSSGEAFIAGIVLICWGAAMVLKSMALLSTGVGIMAVFGFLGVVIFALVVVFGIILVLAAISKARRLRRSLTQTATQPALSQDQQPKVNENTKISPEEKAKIIAKMNKYFEKIEKEDNMEQKMTNASKVTTEDKVKKWLREKGIMSMQQAEKPMKRDAFMHEMRDLYAAEFDDVDDMVEKMEYERNMANKKVDKFHKAEKVRRRFMKFRIRKAISLIMSEFFKQKKHEGSWEYVYEHNKVLLDPVVAVINNKKSTPAEKEEANKVIEKLLHKEYSKEEMDKKTDETSKALAKDYTYAGILKSQQDSIFFKAFSRAEVALLLKNEKVWMLTLLKANPLNDEQKVKVQNGIDKIDDALDTLTTGKDLEL